MRRGAGLGLVVLAGLLLYGGYDPGRSQPDPEPDAWQERLDRLEWTLDQLLRAPPAPRPSRPAPRPRRPRPHPTPPAPSRVVPIVPHDSPPDVPPVPTPAPPAPRRGWTWAQVDAWRAFRDHARE
jgi:hypothetical protein